MCYANLVLARGRRALRRARSPRRGVSGLIVPDLPLEEAPARAARPATPPASRSCRSSRRPRPTSAWRAIGAQRARLPLHGLGHRHDRRARGARRRASPASSRARRPHTDGARSRSASASPRPSRRAAAADAGRRRRDRRHRGSCARPPRRPTRAQDPRRSGGGAGRGARRPRLTAKLPRASWASSSPLIARLVVWIVLWAIGVKAFDAFLITIADRRCVGGHGAHRRAVPAGQPAILTVRRGRDPRRAGLRTVTRRYGLGIARVNWACVESPPSIRVPEEGFLEIHVRGSFGLPCRPRLRSASPPAAATTSSGSGGSSSGGGGRQDPDDLLVAPAAGRVARRRRRPSSTARSSRSSRPAARPATSRSSTSRSTTRRRRPATGPGRDVGQRAQGGAGQVDVVYLGEFNSGASAVSIPILNEAGVPQISPANTDVGLTTNEPGAEPGEPDKYYPTGKRTYARIVPRDTIQGAALVDAMKEDGCTKVASANDKEVYGAGLAKHIELAAKAQGLDDHSATTASTRTRRTTARWPRRSRPRARTASSSAASPPTTRPALQGLRGGAARTRSSTARTASPSPASSTRRTAASRPTSRRASSARSRPSPEAVPAGGPGVLQRLQAEVRRGRPGPVRDLRLRGDELALDAIRALGDNGNDRPGVIEGAVRTKDRDSRARHVLDRRERRHDADRLRRLHVEGRQADVRQDDQGAGRAKTAR